MPGPLTRAPRTGQVPVTTEPVVVVGENERRVGVIVCNSGSTTVFLAFTPSVTATEGFGLPPGSGFGFTANRALFAVTASGTSTMSFIEESE